ncbi:DEAD/DEAH box helicase [Paraclostridium ghonii]|uniref:Superfamily II DNA or RNA helicase/HKD family nuclease/DNA-binding XRE family transcriptional regulator n=1 Tax=Paraclostridium ghonii TaxID=29358 RepID=A0ABU0N377_9FIRM|nr:DEAD/DEAH box helicase [Paeniclostridium ghonii]MDQ0557344.1 superfamily II DNA or RNA helicase/HKD family nuclease/DNA-binding XRE family transcriptional regulator [Paeniclostridium ghonii]
MKSIQGIYEQVISEKINFNLEEEKEYININKDNIQKEEAKTILSKYIQEVTKQSLSLIKNKDLNEQINICNKIIDYLSKETEDEDIKSSSIHKNGQILLSIENKKDNSFINKKIRPITPISQSFLFTNSNHEPDLVGELKREISTSDSIDILVSFIKWTGLRLIKDELIEHTKTKNLRVITTSYMGASDFKAIKFLSELPNTKVKISYDTERTRLHAKSYMFYRDTGFTTAYIGSSNMSEAAMTSGLEWNMKVSEKDSKNIVDKFRATFESYFYDDEFKLFTEEESENLKTELFKAKYKQVNIENEELVNFNIKPYHYQQEMLDKLKVERELLNHNKNLIVAATGVGKTVISAFDYKNYCKINKGKVNRLLFIAHREDILKQSLKTFRNILKDRNFGSLYTGNYTPNNIDYVFMTIQSFNSKKFEEITSSDFYDFIIVDEFHHACANSYQKLLNHYNPKILLGLTATPERMDGKDVLEYFDGKISAKMRLDEAIDRKLLSPFQYFCVSDELNLSNLKWSRGGYDKEQISNLITDNKLRAQLIINSLYDYITDLNEVVGLGFCVSIEHAEFMAKFFDKKGIKSIAISSKCSEEDRDKARLGLIKGEYKFIFVVDLYNEGVDIPEINTILFLRPTDSCTVFLQQLGRGLRLSENKDCLTVLDYIGQAHKNYNFYEKFASISRKKGKALKEEIENGFITLPKGCHIQMEKQAKEYILKNINSFINNKNTILNKIKSFGFENNKKLNLTNFLNIYDVSLRDIYKTKNTFERLCVNAKLKQEFSCKDEKVLTSGILRLINTDSPRLLKFWISTLANIDISKNYEFNKDEERMLLMLYFTLYNKVPIDLGINNMNDMLVRLYENKEIYKEILEVLKYNLYNISTIPLKDSLNYDSLLEVYSTYTREQVLCAFGKNTLNKKYPSQEGVLYIEEKKTDIFFITLNKVDKHFSPSTMYEDYAINDELFHWQSQSKTSIISKTGQRYINHMKTNNNILLFVRENNKEDNITCPYIYLGEACISHFVGSKPINIIWKLKNKIPSKLAIKAEKAL